eukprot:gene16310-biopygen2238
MEHVGPAPSTMVMSRMYYLTTGGVSPAAVGERGRHAGKCRGLVGGWEARRGSFGDGDLRPPQSPACLAFLLPYDRCAPSCSGDGETRRLPRGNLCTHFVQGETALPASGPRPFLGTLSCAPRPLPFLPGCFQRGKGAAVATDAPTNGCVCRSPGMVPLCNQHSRSPGEGLKWGAEEVLGSRVAIWILKGCRHTTSCLRRPRRCILSIPLIPSSFGGTCGATFVTFEALFEAGHTCTHAPLYLSVNELALAQRQCQCDLPAGMARGPRPEAGPGIILSQRTNGISVFQAALQPTARALRARESYGWVRGVLPAGVLVCGIDLWSRFLSMGCTAIPWCKWQFVTVRGSNGHFDSATGKFGPVGSGAISGK